MKTVCAIAIAASLAGCTPNGISAAGSGAAITPGAQITKIDINLTLNSNAQTIAEGSAAGYAPVLSTVSVGSFVQFVNTDGFAHTATAIPSAASFPASSPFSVNAQHQNGATLSSAWSSGTLQPGQSSQFISVDQPGTYLFGCFFHYGAPMRGAIVAQ